MASKAASRNCSRPTNLKYNCAPSPISLRAPPHWPSEFVCNSYGKNITYKCCRRYLKTGQFTLFFWLQDSTALVFLYHFLRPILTYSESFVGLDSQSCSLKAPLCWQSCHVFLYLFVPDFISFFSHMFDTCFNHNLRAPPNGPNSCRVIFIKKPFFLERLNVFSLVITTNLTNTNFFKSDFVRFN